MVDGSKNDSQERSLPLHYMNLDNALRLLNYFVNLIPTVSSNQIYHLLLIDFKF